MINSWARWRLDIDGCFRTRQFYLLTYPPRWKWASFGRIIFFFWQNPQHCEFYRWPKWWSENEADGHIASISAPIELCTASYVTRSFCNIRCQLFCIKCSIVGNDTIISRTLSSTAYRFSLCIGTLTSWRIDNENSFRNNLAYTVHCRSFSTTNILNNISMQFPSN